jgi:predicted ribosome quality control (RQC) complex YloA/Tae2 family protein
MKLELDFTKSVNENAAVYYELAKKWKRKLEGLSVGMSVLDSKIVAGAEPKIKEKQVFKKRERKWFERFHWFFTSEGFLVIGGRDAKGNEDLVNKFMKPDDVYFHADIHGASHVVLKCDGRQPGEISMREAAVFAAVFSKAWQEQISGIDVYSAKPEQVTKKSPSGESIGLGSFMVYGKRVWFKKTPLEFAVGCKKVGNDFELMSGPPSAVKSRCDYYVLLGFGKDSKGAVAKKVAAKFSVKFGVDFSFRLDEIVSLLPNGGASLLVEDFD